MEYINLAVITGIIVPSSHIPNRYKFIFDNGIAFSSVEDVSAGLNVVTTIGFLFSFENTRFYGNN